MIFDDQVPPKFSKRSRTYPPRHDILYPGTSPGYYQHIGREPNTDRLARLSNYQQKKAGDVTMEGNKASMSKIKDVIMVQYDKHFEKKKIQRLINERVQQKLKGYEETVSERRKRLEEMLCKEERQYFYETVQMAQKGDELKMDEMKQRVNILRARREEERLKLVHQKRIEQYSNHCQELRPSLVKKHLMETKKAQLQQIRENEARREAERELDIMWHELTTKEIQAKMERETHDLMAQKLKQQDLLDIWNKQIKGKELLKAEVEKVAAEDRIEMEKLRDQLRREEIEALDAKRKKRDKTASELLEQIAIQDKLLEKRRQEEEDLDQAYNTLAQIEIQKENQAVKDVTAQARRETMLYRKHLKELEEERRKEEKQLEELLMIHRKDIEKKQDEARCKLVEAKLQLQKDVLKGRAEQLAFKRQEAEQQLRLKEAENELLQMSFERNERLQAESDRLEKEAILQYHNDLQKQIDYNNLLRERERQELERQLEEGKKEEEMYRNIVETMIKQNVDTSMVHPFRRVLEQYDCRCPPNNP